MSGLATSPGAIAERSAAVIVEAHDLFAEIPQEFDPAFRQHRRAVIN